MSLNFNGNGYPIAKISGGAKKKTLYLDENNIPTPQKIGNEYSSDGLYKYSNCPYCDKEFLYKSHVQRHVNTLACPVLKKGKGKIKMESNKENQPKNKILNNKLQLIDNSKLRPLPNKNKREILYIAGPQNSGKSYYTSQYLKDFIKMFPKKKIYLFSGIDDDDNFKGIKNIKRMDMDDEELLDDPIDVKKELSNSLVIFDDIDRSNNPEITKYLHELRNDILKNGRDQSKKGKDIYCISTNHQITDGHETRDLLNECTSITIFPHSGSRFGIDRVLQHYIGLGKKEIDKIMKLGNQSRWVTIYKTYPQYVIWEKGASLLNNL